MLPHVDSVVRSLVPSILDIAGMVDVAEELRRIDVLSCLCGLAKACEMLRSIRSSELPPMWAELVEEATFWAEASLWAAIADDRDMFILCESRIRSAFTCGLTDELVH